ncbi:ArsI/CadI family heavy metal resistance metalloenzyme [Anatilimnocola sp. NA78]|uniref:ArsI/CadI family heavy metal resistance metalloenzyme n=1 Tax=Anatilimnocola sp. NA78 TaxID=3415683 RepID=UPI003CE56D2F
MTAVIPSSVISIGSCAREAEAATKQVTKFHLSLNVGDLDKAIAFFRVFLGVEPAKCRADYAKFELNDPPLVMSLEPYQAPPGGNLNHLGFRMSDSAALVDVQRRLELAGIATKREEGVECCYARQTKFWVHDPDGNMWEVYTLDEDLDHRGDGRLPVTPTKSAGDGPPPAIWAHQLGSPFPQRLPILDATVDQAMLQGTLNEKLTAEEQLRRLVEVRRILKPTGIVQMHMLTADRPAGDQPLRLPGPAAAVQAVPTHEEVLQLLRDAGFATARLTLHAQSPCFRLGECELRETRVEGTVS